MRLDPMQARPEGEELVAPCRCCGRSVYQGSGSIVQRTDVVADYWYSWSDGHDGRFTLAVRWGEPRKERIVVVACQPKQTGVEMSILDPQQNPWPRLASIGRVMARAEAVMDPDHPKYFEFLDAVVISERRLSDRLRT